MVRRRRHRHRHRDGAPRASGDGPASQDLAVAQTECSPRERGWSRGLEQVQYRRRVLPARAGMVPGSPSPRPRCLCAPRASGDGPRDDTTQCGLESCSPRERGWSRTHHTERRLKRVLPARAGMVPSRPGVYPGSTRAPRASGDGPSNGLSGIVNSECSPRERGWSGFARLGVVGVQGAPRASGDGPVAPVRGDWLGTCSPRERGWSRLRDLGYQQITVLPARAGMVPSFSTSPSAGHRAPRASGDGPETPHGIGDWHGCSPRERGWSPTARFARIARPVLPARAGMVPG